MSAAPVFVVSCARSGTTLLYHSLVSSGRFVDYRAETHFFDKLLPAYGPFSSQKGRKRLVGAWMRTETFKRFGVDPVRAQEAVLYESETAGEVLRNIFSLAMEAQNRHRWAECTPLHLLEMDVIARELPDALFVHVIRDGRDVSLSLNRVGWINPLPWEKSHKLLVGAWVWEWQVRKGRAIGQSLGERYCEVHFEDLVRFPRKTLDRLSEHIGQSLDWTKINENAVGAVAEPNSAFGAGEEARDGGFDPVFRWKQQCTARELAQLQATVGDTLDELGYPSDHNDEVTALNKAALNGQKHVHQIRREVNLWLKKNTALSRVFTDPEVEDL